MNNIAIKYIVSNIFSPYTITKATNMKWYIKWQYEVGNMNTQYRPTNMNTQI